jgi:hypothetical protein
MLHLNVRYLYSHLSKKGEVNITYYPQYLEKNVTEYMEHCLKYCNTHGLEYYLHANNFVQTYPLFNYVYSCFYPKFDAENGTLLKKDKDHHNSLEHGPRFIFPIQLYFTLQKE